MTAPALDLDALEARLLDAERADLLVEHGVRFTDIKWLIAAARERDEWRKHHCEQRITTPCPSCGHQSLFIAVGGHLTCSWLKCREPSPEAAFKAERQRAEQAEEALADKREGLQRAVEEWRDKYDREAVSAAYATDRAERAEQREARLREALVAAEDIMSRHTRDADWIRETGFVPVIVQARAALKEGQDG